MSRKSGSNNKSEGALFKVFETPSMEHPVRVYRPTEKASSWRIVYYLGTRRRELNATSEERALAIADDLMQRASVESSANEDKPIEFLVGAFVASKSGDWAPRTRSIHLEAAERLPEWFRRMPCRDWTRAVSQQVLNEVSRQPRKALPKGQKAALAEAAAGGSERTPAPGTGPVNFPLGTTTYRNVGALLRGMVGVAESEGFFPTGRLSPMKGVPYQRYAAKRPVVVGPDGKRNPYAAHIPLDDALVITREMMEAAAAAAKGLTARPVEDLRLRFLMASGLRWGEHIALTVDDLVLDEDCPSVTVTKQHYQYTDKDERRLVTVLNAAPKWGRVRVALLDPKIVPEMEAHVAGIKARLMDEGLAGKQLKIALGKALLFPAARGGICWPNNYNRRVWSEIAERLGWSKVEDLPAQERPVGMTKISGWVVTPHSLRHAYVTWLLSDVGVPASLVAQYAGHKDSGFTEQVYGRRTSTAVASGMEYVTAAQQRRAQAQEPVAEEPEVVVPKVAATGGLPDLGLNLVGQRQTKPGGSVSPSGKPSVPKTPRKKNHKPATKHRTKPRRAVK